MLDIPKNANLALSFLLEPCALVAFGYWGFKTGRNSLMKFVLGISAPLLMAVFRDMFLAPKANIPLPQALNLVPKLVVFGLASPALYVSGRPALAWLTCGSRQAEGLGPVKISSIGKVHLLSE